MKRRRRFRQLKLLPADELRKLKLQERIRRNVKIHPVTGCWIWTGSVKRSRGGALYPRMTMRMPGYDTPRGLVATRVALEVFVEPPPTPLHEAAHDPEICPYALCVYFVHLRWASRKENEADKRHPSRLRLREVHPPLHRIFFSDDPVEVPF